MNNLKILSALLATATALSAQCIAPSSLNTNPPDFSASHYVGSPNPPVVPDPGFSSLWDMTVNGSLTISSIDSYLYNDGVNPYQVGNTGPFDFWICPTTHTGNELIPANWTLVGSGTFSVADSSSHSPAVFNVPVVLTPGTYGCALNLKVTTVSVNAQPLMRCNPLVTLASVVPNTPMSVSDQFMSINNEVTQRIAFVSGIGANHTINIQINYAPNASSAFSSTYGAGCYFRPQSFYETFQFAAPIDLSNSGITLINNGPNYTAVPSSPFGAYVPTTLPLVGVAGGTIMGDDDITLPITLPFTFSAPGGVSTSQIQIGSNGFVYLSATAGSAFGYYDDINGFLTGVPRIALGFGDWLPSGNVGGNGNIYYEVDPSNAFVTITYNDVAEWVPTPPTIARLNGQIVLYASGQIDLHWGSCSQQIPGGAPVLVGYSNGDGNDPGSRNISAVPFVTGNGDLPPSLKTDTRPILGGTWNLVTNQVDPATFLVLTILSFTPPPPAPFNSLAPFGMPGCTQEVGSIDATFVSLAFAGTTSVAISAPALPGFIGIQVRAQAAPFTSGLNQAGIVTSNGVCCKLGL